MRVAILMTNTDTSDFAARHPLDGAKFSDLLRLGAPACQPEVFAVVEGDFPADITAFDAVLIGGSPASVHEPLDWIAPLKTLVRQIIAAQIPLYGVCFGHQVIAAALGGTVGPNPGGWVMGRVTTHSLEEDASLHVYAAHTEQVLSLPEGAHVTAKTPGCPIAGFGIGDRVRTTQYHPEMTPDFIAALVEELAETLGPEVTARARASLSETPDQAAWAKRITRCLSRG